MKEELEIFGYGFFMCAIIVCITILLIAVSRPARAFDLSELLNDTYLLGDAVVNGTINESVFNVSNWVPKSFYDPAAVWRVEKNGLQREVNSAFRANPLSGVLPIKMVKPEVLSHSTLSAPTYGSRFTHYTPYKSRIKERMLESVKRSNEAAYRVMTYNEWYRSTKWAEAAQATPNKDDCGYCGNQKRTMRLT